MNSEDVAWAAGLFEGEGYITVDKSGHHSNHPRPRLGINMTDEDVLRRFAQIVAAGKVMPYKRKKAAPHHKDCWSWRSHAVEDTERILRAFLPFFGRRRTETAVEALELIALRAKATRTCWCGKEFTFKTTEKTCCLEHRRVIERAKARAAYRKKMRAQAQLALEGGEMYDGTGKRAA